MRTTGSITALLCCLLVVSVGMAQMWPFPGPGRSYDLLSQASALYFFSGSNVGGDIARYEPLGNLLLSSEDLTNAAWSAVNSTITDSDSFLETTATAVHGIQQNLPSVTPIATMVEVRAVVSSEGRDWVYVKIYSSSFTNPSVSQYFDLVNVVPGTYSTGSFSIYVSSSIEDSGGGNRLIKLKANNTNFGFNRLQVFSATGDGINSYEGDISKGLRVTNVAVCPGTCGDYQQTNSEQVVYNYGTLGASANGQRGSTAAADANDPSYPLWSRNNLAAGSTRDITSASWTHTAATTDADTLTFAAQNDNITQTIATLAGVTYRACVNVQNVSGNTGLTWQHTDSATGNTTALTIDSADTRRCVSFLGKTGGGNVTFGIQDANVAGQGAVNVDYWQAEAASVATAYTNPATESKVVGLNFVTDDYLIPTSFSEAGGVHTVVAVYKMSSTMGVTYILDAETGRLVFGANAGNVGFYDGTWRTTGTNLVLSKWLVTAFSLTPGTGTSYVFHNGVQLGAGLDYESKALGGNIKIGASNTGVGTASISIAELSYHPGALTSAQICGDCDGLDGTNDGLMGEIASGLYNGTLPGGARGICIAGAEAAYCQSAPTYMSWLPEPLYQLAQTLFALPKYPEVTR